MALLQVPGSTIGNGNAAALQRHPALKSTFLSPSLPHFMLPSTIAATSRTRRNTAPRISMRMASKSKQAYICRDCGSVSSPNKLLFYADKYFCPVCGAPKRRFREYQPAVTKNVNDKDVRKARKAQIQKDESIGKALPIAIAIGVVALVALYFYLNSSF